MRDLKKITSIEETLAEVRRKDKRYNYVILIIGIVLVLFITSLIIYGQYKKKTQIIEHQRLEIETKEKELIALELKNKESSEDSILNIVKSLQTEISKIRTNAASLSKEQLVAKLDVAQTKLDKISYAVNEHTIVQYYKCRGDGEVVENAIKNMKNFNLSVRQSKYDYGTATGTNTIWYGKNVDKSEVYQLARNLKKQKIQIKNIIPFPNTKENIQKQNMIEVGYKYTSNTKTIPIPTDPTVGRDIKSNSKYTIRFYSYNPDNLVKKRLLLLLKKYKYKVKNYPDWEKKPSFFSNSPTVLYYSDKTKGKAHTLARELSSSKIRNVKFKVARGNGYGISEKEKGNTFIIHYMK